MSIEEQAKFWKEECSRFEGAFQRAVEMERENRELNDRLLALEDELEKERDYSRLLREERDDLRAQRDDLRAQLD